MSFAKLFYLEQKSLSSVKETGGFGLLRWLLSQSNVESNF